MLTTCPTHCHDGTTTVLHRRLHVAEVTLDTPVAGHGDQFRDTLHRIHQDVVSPLESILHREVRIRVHVAQPFVVHDEQGVHVLTHLVDTLQRLDNLALLLKVKGDGHHPNGQQSHVLSHLSHHRSSTRSRATTHASCYEHHLRAVTQQFLDVREVRLRLLLAQFRVSPGTQSRTAQHQLHGHRRTRQ